MEAILQRLKSKTYWVAVIGALLTVLETHSNVFLAFLPPEMSKYMVLLWPVFMIALREVTTTSLSNK